MIGKVLTHCRLETVASGHAPIVAEGDRVQRAGDDRIYYVQHSHPSGYWHRVRDLSGQHEHVVDAADLVLVPDVPWTCPDLECNGAVMADEGEFGPAGETFHRFKCPVCSTSYPECGLVKRVVLVALRTAFGNAPMVRPATAACTGGAR